MTDTGSAATRQPPSGTVTYTLENGSTGTFDPDASCDLEPSGAFSSKCTVSYSPAKINGGEHDLLATYGGDPEHGRATTRLALEVTPANDETDSATRISLPAKLTGTTEGATWGDDPELCGDAWAPVWYSLRPAEKARLAVRLTVTGRVDSVIAVFRLDRSKFTSLGCQLTDASGVAGLSFDVQGGGSYLVAVAAPWDARSGSFLLEAAKVPPIGLAGPLLRRDARVSLDPLLRPGAAFTLRLKQGETIKLNAVPSRGSCMEVAILRPGARSEAEVLKASEGCAGYLVYTPEVDGWASYPLVVRFADASSGKPTATAEEARTSSWSATDLQIHMRRADPDDLAPGILLHDGKVTRGALAAGIADAVDVYRFRLTGTRDATVWVRGTSPTDLLLLSPTGATIACACEGAISSTVAKRLGRGTFFAVVRGRPGATGRYARLRAPAKADDGRGQVGRRRSGQRDCRGHGLAGRRWARRVRAAAVRPAQRLALLAIDEAVAAVGQDPDGRRGRAGPLADQSAVHGQPRRQPEHERLDVDSREVSGDVAGSANDGGHRNRRDWVSAGLGGATCGWSPGDDGIRAFPGADSDVRRHARRLLGGHA